MTSRATASCGRSDGRDLAQWRVAPASVLQYGLHRFAGRCRFCEHDGAGMKRRALRWARLYARRRGNRSGMERGVM